MESVNNETQLYIPKSRIAGLEGGEGGYIELQEMLPNGLPKFQKPFRVYPFTLPPEVPERSSGSIIFFNIWGCLFHLRHSNRCVVIAHYGFNLHFLMTTSAKYFFTCLLTTKVFPFVKCLFKSFAHFSIKLSDLFLLICRNMCMHISRFYISIYTYFI